jgi:hypothetical protein
MLSRERLRGGVAEGRETPLAGRRETEEERWSRKREVLGAEDAIGSE